MEWAASNGHPELVQLLAEHTTTKLPVEVLIARAQLVSQSRHEFQREQHHHYAEQVTAELEHSELEHAHMLPVLPHQHLETPLVERERLRVGTAAQTAPPPRARGVPRTAAS